MSKMIKMAPQRANFKQISFVEATGRLYLEDYNNNHFECNLYGQKQPIFYPNLTGLADFAQRQKKTLLPSLTFKPCETQYFPQTKYFEGYAQFPLPLCSPFMNVIDNPSPLHEMMLKERRLKNSEKNKRLIAIQGKEGLNHLTSTLAGDETAIKAHLINSINNYIKDFKAANKYKPELVFHDHNILALKKLRRLLRINFDNDTINEKVLPHPHEDLKQRYELIRKHYMKPLPQAKRLRTIEDNGHATTGNMLNLISQASTFQRTDSSFSFGKTSVHFSPKKLHQQPTDLSFSNVFYLTSMLVSNDNKDDFDSKAKSEKNILFKCNEEKRLLTTIQPIRIKEAAIIQKGKPKLLTPGDLYKKELLLMQKVNPQLIQREKERNDFDRKVLEKKKQNKLIYETIKIGKAGVKVVAPS